MSATPRRAGADAAPGGGAGRRPPRLEVQERRAGPPPGGSSRRPRRSCPGAPARLPWAWHTAPRRTASGSPSADPAAPPPGARRTGTRRRLAAVESRPSSVEAAPAAGCGSPSPGATTSSPAPWRTAPAGGRPGSKRRSSLGVGVAGHHGAQVPLACGTASAWRWRQAASRTGRSTSATSNCGRAASRTDHRQHGLASSAPSSATIETHARWVALRASCRQPAGDQVAPAATPAAGRRAAGRRTRASRSAPGRARWRAPARCTPRRCPTTSARRLLDDATRRAPAASRHRAQRQLQPHEAHRAPVAVAARIPRRRRRRRPPRPPSSLATHTLAPGHQPLHHGQRTQSVATRPGLARHTSPSTRRRARRRSAASPCPACAGTPRPARRPARRSPPGFAPQARPAPAPLPASLLPRPVRAPLRLRRRLRHLARIRLPGPSGAAGGRLLQNQEMPVPSAEWEVKAGLSMRGPGGRSGPARLVLARFWRRNAAADSVGPEASGREQRLVAQPRELTYGEAVLYDHAARLSASSAAPAGSTGRRTPSPSIPPSITGRWGGCERRLVPGLGPGVSCRRWPSSPSPRSWAR